MTKHKYDLTRQRDRLISDLKRITGWTIDLPRDQPHITRWVGYMCNHQDKNYGYPVLNEAIRRQLSEHALYKELLRSGDTRKIREYLKSFAVLRIDKASRGTPLEFPEGLVAYEKELEDRLGAVLKGGRYTIADARMILGAFAFLASCRDCGYHFTLEEEDWLETSDVGAIVSMAEQAGILVRRGNEYSFVLKFYRLLMAAAFRAEVDNQISSRLSFICRRSRDSYAMEEMLRILCRLADVATRQSSFKVEHSAFTHSDLEEAAIAAALDTGILEEKEGFVYFTFKYHRLLLAYLYRTLKSHADEVDWVDYGFESYPEDGYEAHKANHLELNFYGAVTYYGIYAMHLDESLRRLFFHRIEQYALDYSTWPNERGFSRRKLQIKAIQMLSYYLVAGAPLLFEDERKMFQIVYSENLYPAQSIYIKEFLDRRPVYKDIVRRTFEESLTFQNGFIKSQPYYNFLLCMLAEKGKNRSYFYDAIDVQDRSWRQMAFTGMGEIDLQAILNSIRESLPLFREDISLTEPGRAASGENTGDVLEHLMLHVYAVQTYAISMANILMRDPVRADDFRRDMQLPGNQTLITEAIETMIYADYYTRKFNQLYVRGEFLATEDNIDKMYLLCGVTRFFAQYHDRYYTIDMPEQVKDDYMDWINMENNQYIRYACLLLRIAAHIKGRDWTSPITHQSIQSYTPAIFLQYDAMPPHLGRTQPGDRAVRCHPQGGARPY